jgi:TolA-binding protein
MPSPEDNAERLRALEHCVNDHQSAISRIGEQVRVHAVHIKELRQQNDAQTELIREAKSAAEAMQHTASRFETYIERHEDQSTHQFERVNDGIKELASDVRQVLVDRARDESRTGRQAIWLWMTSVTAVGALVWAVMHQKVLGLFK